nr:MAG TPA: hypothetical protein [Bacteriophage sp.]
MTMLNSILENLISVGWSMLIFLAAYLANVTFSLWYNIKLQKEPFDRAKLIASAIKIVTFVIGLVLLCVSVTTLPLFANETGWTVPQEYSDIFADLVIIGAVLLVSCKYIKEAFGKFTAILNAGTADDKTNERKEGNENE